MARPRNDQGGPDARTRIVDAFWTMLEEGPYDRITVRGLAAKARVNHNTIYRHFDSVEHVARTAVAEVYSAEAALQLLAFFSDPELADASDLAERGFGERFDKAMLAMHSGSAMLVTAVQETIRACWMQVAGTSWEDLPAEKRLEISFALGGITSVLQTFHGIDDFQWAKALATSHIGAAVRQTLAELAMGR